MRKKAMMLIIISLLIAMNLSFVMAQIRTVGVSEGDWFNHSELSISWSSNDTSATFPPSDSDWLKDWNKTEWMKVSIQSISGTNITSEVTEHFTNGSEKIRSGWIDIDNGNCSKLTNETMDMTFMFISANLGVNDTLYSSGNYSNWKINETITRDYPDSTRETNHFNMTWEYSWTINETDYYNYYSMVYYWDKPTGILAEWHIKSINKTGSYLTEWSAFSKITDSNVWVVPEFHTWTLTLLIFAIFTATIILTKRRLLQN